jgi:hypothetical protein
MTECLTLGCENQSTARGICIHCYNKLIRKIKAGKTTWAREVRAGRCKRSRTDTMPADIGRGFGPRFNIMCG